MAIYRTDLGMGEWELGTFRLPLEAAEVSQRAHSESQGQDRAESELDHKPKSDEWRLGRDVDKIGVGNRDIAQRQETRTGPGFHPQNLPSTHKRPWVPSRGGVVKSQPRAWRWKEDQRSWGKTRKGGGRE